MKALILATLVTTISAGAAFAHHEARRQPPMQTQAPAASQIIGTGTGLIQQIDREKGTVTIKHGPLQGIKMPAMTMSYVVKDKAMLSNLWSPQMVDFELTYDGKTYLITKIK